MSFPHLCRLVGLILCGLPLALSLHAAAEIRYEPGAPWVTPAELAASPAPATPPASGLAYELCDYQTHVGTRESYTRIATRVLTEYGRANSGELRVGFEPSYQTLFLHHVRIIRDGEVLDRLDPAKVKLLHRETQAESGLYNGRLTALVIVEDLRVGDLLDYAFTIQGENPVFAGRHTDSWSLQVTSPIQRMRVRLLAPTDRPLRWRIVGGGEEPPAIDPHDGLAEWTWDRREIPGFDYESDAPEWHVQYPTLQVSEYADWAAVAEWGCSLYPMDTPIPSEVEAFVAAWEKKPEAERAVAALQLVQDEIRYLSMSLGESSHRPHPPADVYAQRFGDCKDKAYLLTVLLRRLGLDAAPALVDSDSGANLDRWLPSPYLFDHVIVHLQLAGKEYWLDPTRSYQAGPLEERNVTTFGWALPLRAGIDRLVAVTPTRESIAKLEITEAYSSTAKGAPVSLRVHRTFQGPSAVSFRSYLADNTPERVGKDRLNRYAQLFPAIRLDAPPTWTDDRERNRIEIDERYTVPDFWKHDPADDSYRCEVVPLALNDRVDTPASTHRRTPLGFAHPFHIGNRIVLDLDEPVGGDPISWIERTPAFVFSKRTQTRGNRFELEYAYRSTADHIPAEQCRDYAAQVVGIRNRIAHTFTFHAPSTDGPATDPVSGPEATAPAAGAPPEFSLNWPSAMILALAIPVALYLGWRLSRPAPPAPPPLPPLPGEPDLRGIGGWLILVAISLVVNIGRMIWMNTQTLPPVLNLQVWLPLTTPGQPNYHPLFAPTLLGEAAANLLIAMAFLLAAYLFVTRRRRFPQVMIFILASNIVIMIADAVAAHQLPGIEQKDRFEAIAGAFKGVATAALWIPYYLVSKRVKATFVR